MPRSPDVPRETARHGARAKDTGLSRPSACGPTTTRLCSHERTSPGRPPAPEVGRRSTATPPRPRWRPSRERQLCGPSSKTRGPSPSRAIPVSENLRGVGDARTLPQGTAETPPRPSTRWRGASGHVTERLICPTLLGTVQSPLTRASPSGERREPTLPGRWSGAASAGGGRRRPSARLPSWGRPAATSSRACST